MGSQYYCPSQGCQKVWLSFLIVQNFYISLVFQFIFGATCTAPRHYQKFPQAAVAVCVLMLRECMVFNNCWSLAYIATSIALFILMFLSWKPSYFLRARMGGHSIHHPMVLCDVDFASLHNHAIKNKFTF